MKRYDSKIMISISFGFFWILSAFVLIKNMTLRADRLKSNYLGCWIFEISSAPDLDPFSILIFVFLNIRSVEFDEFQYIKSFWVVLDLGTLRLARVWIYLWVFWDEDHSCGTKFSNFSWKNDFSQFHPGSIWDGPWITRAWKKHQFGSIGSFRNH